MDAVASEEAKREDRSKNNLELEEKKESSDSKHNIDCSKITNLLNQLSLEAVPLRVHDVIIQGNTRTKDSAIEAVMEDLKHASTFLKIIEDACIAEAWLKDLGIFEHVKLAIAAGPRELPGTVNVVYSGLEPEKLREVNVSVSTKLGAISPSVEGTLKWKNLLGLADIWDGSVSYGKDERAEFSTGVSLPRIGGWWSPVFTRVYLESQDWLKLSSYKQQSLGLALGLLSTKNHKLSYDLAWRTLTDPSKMASKSVSGELGHNLLSSIKYIYQLDARDSPWRPTRGYAYSFITQLAGLYPHGRTARFLRQEFDLRYALPLVFGNTALNFGISGGVIIPWGKKTSLPDRIFMGGSSFSPVGSLGQLGSFSGFSHRGLGPSEPRRQTKETTSTSYRDALGGDLAFAAFANISFDLPVKVLRDAGIYGHVFACAGNLVNIQEKGWYNFSPQTFLQTSRTSVGCGFVIPPTRILPAAMELNFCRVLRHSVGCDQVRASAQFNLKF